MSNFIVPQRNPPGCMEERINDILDGFRTNYNTVKRKKNQKDEDDCKLLGIPGPFQYRKFGEFFSFFRKEEHIIEKFFDTVHTYDLFDTEKLTALPTLEFLQNLYTSSYEVREKDVAISSGSFWKQNQPTGVRIISHLEELHKKGARIKILSQAKETEENIVRLSVPIKNNSRFGLYNRIPIHFIKVGDDFLQIEFPHTEASLFRLIMFLDLQKIEPELKPGKTVKDLSDFFDKMLREAQ